MKERFFRQKFLRLMRPTRGELVEAEKKISAKKILSDVSNDFCNGLKMTAITIPFNRPHICGSELAYIGEVMKAKKLSGNGPFTKKCEQFFEEKWGMKRAFLTTSCTDALEMCALLLNLQPGDEVIAPSYTFPSTVNPFVMVGAKIVFADSSSENPNMDLSHLRSLITKKTKAIVLTHYAGIALDMDEVLRIAKEHGLFVVEDAAHSIDSYYQGIPLGKIGNLGTFSFHETKNISSGEGGMLTVNDPSLIPRAEILWEKGTNRSQFFRGEVDKYTWVDVGSSFLPSELIAAFLYGQLENLEKIQKKRLQIWNGYYQGLKLLADLGYFQLPYIPSFATHNAHLFYIVCKSFEEREALIAFLKTQGILAIFHYQPLHLSPFYLKHNQKRSLPHCERYGDCLLRLPLFYDLEIEDIRYINKKIEEFYT